MDLPIQETQTNHTSSRELDQLISPAGWVTTTLKNKNLKTEPVQPPAPDEAFISHNLPLAAARAEQLIDALDRELTIPVPVSYMRIETGSLFHILLLISREDFLSPKIQAARLLADKYAKTDGNYDIRFSFAVESENLVNTSSKFSEYKLMHVRNTETNEE